MIGKTSQEELQKLFAPIVKAIDAAPIGEVIPSTWEAPEGYTLEKLVVDGVPVEHLIPKDKKTNRVLYELHGGAYVVKIMDSYRDCAVKFSEAAGGAEVFYIDYRVAPKDKFPSALEDAVKVYKWILSKGYDSKNIIIEGDSAGGNLALVTTMYLKEKKIPMPKLVIGICPWADLEDKTESRRTNYDKDLLLGRSGIQCKIEIEKPQYAEGMNLKDPYISPIYGDYRGFPEMLLLSGSYEVFIDDAVKVYEKAKKAGVKVMHKVYEGMSHDFLLVLPTIEESKKAWTDIAMFIEEGFNRS